MSKQVCIFGNVDQAHYVLGVMAGELEREDIVSIISTEDNLIGRYFDYVFTLRPLGDWTLQNLLRHGTQVTPVYIESNGQPIGGYAMRESRDDETK